jgi:hypothetical protein
VDADSGPTGSPLLDLIAARRQQPSPPIEAPPPQPRRPEAPGPEPVPALGTQPQLPEGPLAVAARLRRQRAEAARQAGVVVGADGAPGRLHALHRRKTRGTDTVG